MMFENELMQNKNLSYLAVSLGLYKSPFSRLPILGVCAISRHATETEFIKYVKVTKKKMQSHY